MPRLFDSIATELSSIAVLSYLHPYMQDANKFNGHRTQISEAINAFMTQTKINGVKSPYTAEELLNAYQDKITVVSIPQEDVKKFENLMKLNTDLHEKSKGSISDSFAYGLTTYRSKEEAQTALEKDGDLYLMSEALATVHQKTAEEIRTAMGFYIDRHFEIQQSLAPHTLIIEKNRAIREAQELKNKEIRAWARKHAQHAAYLEHLGSCMKGDAEIEQVYTLLTTMKNEDPPFTQEQMPGREEVLCLPTGPNISKTIPATIATVLPSLLRQIAKDLSPHYVDLDTQGNPSKLKHEKELSNLIQTIGAILLIGLVVTSIFTVIPLIPVAASEGLNTLYSGLFAASTSPVFSFTEIYCISLAFVLAIDGLVFAAAKYWEKHGERLEIEFRERYIAPKLEIKVADFADAQVKTMDDRLAVKDRPTRKPFIEQYGQSLVKKAPVSEQNDRNRVNPIFNPSSLL